MSAVVVAGAPGGLVDEVARAAGARPLVHGRSPAAGAEPVDWLRPEAFGPMLAGCRRLVLLLDGPLEGPEMWVLHLKGAQAVLHAASAWGELDGIVLVSSALLDEPEPVDPDAPPARYGSAWLAVRASMEARATLLARELGVPLTVVRAGHPVGGGRARHPELGALLARLARSEEVVLGGHALPLVAAGALVEALARAAAGEELPGAATPAPGLTRVLAVGALRDARELAAELGGLARCVPPRDRAGVRRLFAPLGRVRPLVPAWARRPPVAEVPPGWCGAAPPPGALRADLVA